MVVQVVVGVAGFEPTTFRSQSGRATKLRHTPSVRHVGYMPVDGPMRRVFLRGRDGSVNGRTTGGKAVCDPPTGPARMLSVPGSPTVAHALRA